MVLGELLQRCGEAASILNKNGMLPVHLSRNECSHQMTTLFVERNEALVGVLNGSEKILLHMALEKKRPLEHIQFLLCCLSSAALLKDGNGVPCRSMLALPECWKVHQENDGHLWERRSSQNSDECRLTKAAGYFQS